VILDPDPVRSFEDEGLEEVQLVGYLEGCDRYALENQIIRMVDHAELLRAWRSKPLRASCGSGFLLENGKKSVMGSERWIELIYAWNKDADGVFHSICKIGLVARGNWLMFPLGEGLNFGIERDQDSITKQERWDCPQ
jgi:hypothetical protein